MPEYDPTAELRRVIAATTYKTGWTIRTGGPGNNMLCVYATTPDSNQPGTLRTTQHMWPLPTGLDHRDACRWLHARIVDAERHEVGEFLTIDGRRPFYPGHQGADPYAHVEHWGDE